MHSYKQHYLNNIMSSWEYTWSSTVIWERVDVEILGFAKELTIHYVLINNKQENTFVIGGEQEIIL